MPSYRYQCVHCKHAFNVIHSIKEKLTLCTECGGELKRIICFDGHIELKGEGFYCNDYKKKGEKNGKED